MSSFILRCSVITEKEIKIIRTKRFATTLIFIVVAFLFLKAVSINIAYLTNRIKINAFYVMRNNWQKKVYSATSSLTIN